MFFCFLRDITPALQHKAFVSAIMRLPGFNGFRIGDMAYKLSVRHFDFRRGALLNFIMKQSAADNMFAKSERE